MKVLITEALGKNGKIRYFIVALDNIPYSVPNSFRTRAKAFTWAVKHALIPVDMYSGFGI